MHSFFKEDQTIGKILLQSCIRTDHLTMKGNIENLVFFEKSCDIFIQFTCLFGCIPSLSMSCNTKLNISSK